MYGRILENLFIIDVLYLHSKRKLLQRKIENFANELMFQAFDGDLIWQIPTF